ncbi:MAG: glycosyltransferase [Phycisphaerales bacterium]
MLTYIIPTRDRPDRLAQTLAALGSLRGHPECAVEAIVIDNASRTPPQAPPVLANGIPVRTIYRNTNEGAASRNAAVQAADPSSEWVVMLDDDSYPVDTGFIRRLAKAPADVAAVSADIYLPGLARRESGGLPEVFIGCGVAIRRPVFLALGEGGGYDPSFNYYAEEYDLAARMILAGYRIQFDPWFRVEHHKAPGGRDMNTILARLVRNNGWVMQRYAPDDLRRAMIREQRRRYRQIALKEHSVAGFREGLVDLSRTIRAQRRTPMPRHLFERFTGVAHAREALQAAYAQNPFRTVALVDEGKNGWVIRKALAELGVAVLDTPPAPSVPDPLTVSPPHRLTVSSSADALVIGTMSPGPMLDSWERRTLLAPPGRGPRLIAPWLAVTHRATTPGDTLIPARAKVPA